MHHFQNTSSASGDFAHKPPAALRLWTSLGTSVPQNPEFAHP